MFTYVVLHYVSTDMTVNCVNKMLKLSETSNVVIVDNCSPNSSGEQLSSIFKHNSRVHIIINNKNEGFAKGNNLGYMYAKDVLKSNYIAVSNNDVLISQPDFECIITSFMEKNNIDVCGPDILTPDRFHQNPFCLKSISTSKLVKTIILNKLKLILFSIPLLFNMYAEYRKKHRVIVGSINKPNNVTNCVLHGSFIVFNKKYISKESYAFLPLTYMYGEEFILYDYLKYNGYKTGVCATAEIIHLGGKSTTQQFGDIEKIKYKFKNITDSLVVLLKLRKQYRNNGI